MKLQPLEVFIKTDRDVTVTLHLESKMKLLITFSVLLVTALGAENATEVPEPTEKPSPINLRNILSRAMFWDRYNNLFDLRHQRFRGRHIALYFSGQFCPPCRRFTPVLYRTWRNEPNLEVIWISQDRNEREAYDYYGQMSWPRMDFVLSGRIGEELFDAVEPGSKTIPRLVMLDPDLNVINPDARVQVERGGRFPWPAEA